MTPTTLKPLVSRLLGIQDTALDDQYEAGYLAAVQTANHLTAIKLSYPHTTGESEASSATINHAAVTEDAIISVYMEHPTYGSYPLVRMNNDEAARRFGSLLAVTGKPKVYVPGPTTFRVAPTPAVAQPTTYTYVFIPTTLRAVAAGSELLNGFGKQYHELVAYLAAIELLRQDGELSHTERIQQLTATFEAERASAVRALHRQGAMSSILKSAIPEGLVKQ